VVKGTDRLSGDIKLSSLSLLDAKTYDAVWDAYARLAFSRVRNTILLAVYHA
jgi:hypothetical protein